MSILSRRRFLASSAIAIAGVAGAPLLSRAVKAATSEASLLRVDSRIIDVNGKPAKVFALLGPDSKRGLRLSSGGAFRVRLENSSSEPTLIHWHGLLPPYGQDGVPDLPQPLLQAGQAYDYDFPLETPGTHWMHAHTLQEQRLLAAPLIVTDPAEEGLDEQDVTVLLHDFSFRSPEELLADLAGDPTSVDMAGHGSASAAHNMPGMAPMDDMPGMAHQGTAGMALDVNDIEYDAYLANDRTLADPEVFRVEEGGIVRLRLINGATATGFWIDLGTLDGDVIAVDGNPVAPVTGRRFPIGMGQRIDIRLRLPHGAGAWPILALREGAAERTGFILATKDAAIQKLSAIGSQPAPALDLALEIGLRAQHALTAKEPDQQKSMVLGGDMASYTWSIDGRTWDDGVPLSVKAGDRVEVTMQNESMMAHPMHLHGHHFQVVAIDDKRFSGAARDTVWVPPMRRITIAFDAVNPGTWAFHCHHLYHMARGMMTSIEYAA